MAGGAPAIDSSNNIYVITGNGDWDGAKDFGDSFLKLSTASGLSLTDWFTPWNQATLDGMDADVGSGGAVVLIDLPMGAAFQHLLIGGGKGDDGKSGKLYVVSRDSLGHNHASDDNQIAQEFSFGHSIYGTPAFWQNIAYFAGGNGPATTALNTTTMPIITNISTRSRILQGQV